MALAEWPKAKGMTSLFYLKFKKILKGVGPLFTKKIALFSICLGILAPVAFRINFFPLKYSSRPFQKSNFLRGGTTFGQISKFYQK